MQPCMGHRGHSEFPVGRSMNDSVVVGGSDHVNAVSPVEVPVASSQQATFNMFTSAPMTDRPRDRPDSAPPIASGIGEWVEGGPGQRLLPLPVLPVSLSPVTPSSEFAATYARMTNPEANTNVQGNVMNTVLGAYEFGLEDYDLIDWLVREGVVNSEGAMRVAERLGERRVDYTKDSPVIKSASPAAPPAPQSLTADMAKDAPLWKDGPALAPPPLQVKTSFQSPLPTVFHIGSPRQTPLPAGDPHPSAGSPATGQERNHGLPQ